MILILPFIEGEDKLIYLLSLIKFTNRRKFSKAKKEAYEGGQNSPTENQSLSNPVSLKGKTLKLPFYPS